MKAGREADDMDRVVAPAEPGFHADQVKHRGSRVRIGFLLLSLGIGSLAECGSGASAAQAPVGLGTAASFAVLAGARVTNTGVSNVSGDLGVSPGSAVTGFPPGVVSGGIIHVTDAVASGAQSDVVIAYNDAAGRSSSATVTADLGGQTLVSGVYSGPTLGLTGTLTLDAQGDPNAVFVFQAASTLITASASRVALVNGASACNVFWQIGSSATLATNSVFVGTILALTSVTATTGASVTGRLFARNGAVTLDANTITRPTGCAAAAPVSSTITAEPPLQGLFTLHAHLARTSDGVPVVGRTIVLSTSSGAVGQAVTDATGLATFSGLGAAAQIVLENGYTATFGGDSAFLASSARATLLTAGAGSSQAGTPASPGTRPGDTTAGSAPLRPPTRLPATGATPGVLVWALAFLALGLGLAVRLRALRHSD
jgi:hypothetical protein